MRLGTRPLEASEVLGQPTLELANANELEIGARAANDAPRLASRPVPVGHGIEVEQHGLRGAERVEQNIDLVRGQQIVGRDLVGRGVIGLRQDFSQDQMRR